MVRRQDNGDNFATRNQQRATISGGEGNFVLINVCTFKITERKRISQNASEKEEIKTQVGLKAGDPTNANKTKLLYFF